MTFRFDLVSLVKAAAAASAGGLGQLPKLDKLAIVNLDQGGVVEAQYNPKELQLDKAVTWGQNATSKGDHPELTFTGGGARALTLELFFDAYETGDDVHKLHVEPLQKLMQVMSTTRGEQFERPPRVVIMWGEDLPKFQGVIESVGVKYTMFLPGGRPVRATCTVKLIEAFRDSFEKRPRRG